MKRESEKMSRFSDVLKNISYTLTSNFLSLCVSIIVSLLLPKILGVADYGYYQLYIFYVSYVGMLHFGWCDGIYLRYGGKDYDELDKKLLAGQFYGLLCLQLVITLLFVGVILSTSNTDAEKFAVLISSVMNIIILNLRTFLILTLQATNKMKEYSTIIISDRLIFVTVITILILMKIDKLEYYIFVDIISKLISLFIALAKCSDVVFEKKMIFSYRETKLNIFSGINLMFANIASMLIIGIIRFGIQNKWDVETFGKISLTLSISNMLMVFVGAISLAIFPIVKKTNKKNYEVIYPKVRTIVSPLTLLLLLFYFPAEIILSKWLPQYRESLKYMVIVFPIIVFESKVSLLTNTFLKALRMEKEIFKINLISAICSGVLTIIFVYIFNSLFFSMLSIVICLGIRCIVSELALKKELKINIRRDLVLEIFLIIIFIFVGWNFSKRIGLLVYSTALIIYFVLKMNDLKDIKKLIKNI